MPAKRKVEEGSTAPMEEATKQTAKSAKKGVATAAKESTNGENSGRVLRTRTTPASPKPKESGKSKGKKDNAAKVTAESDENNKAAGNAVAAEASDAPSSESKPLEPESESTAPAKNAKKGKASTKAKASESNAHEQASETTPSDGAAEPETSTRNEDVAPETDASNAADSAPASTTIPAMEEAPKGNLSPGDMLPDLKVQTNDGSTVQLQKLAEDSALVIFLYPKASTPGCTKQACGFRDQHEKFTNAHYTIYGLSYDSPKSQTTWKEKNKLPYTLLTTTPQDLEALKIFANGKNIKRGHIVVEKGGKIRQIGNYGPEKSVSESLTAVNASS